MHDCQRLREDLTDLILGGKPLKPAEELADELNSCEQCGIFYKDALAVVKIVDAAEVSPPELPEDYWKGFEGRLRSSLLAARRPPSPSAEHPGPMLKSAVLVMAAALLLAVTLGLFRAVQPPVDDSPGVTRKTQVHVDDEHVAGLDPGTVDYLEQSELFLRTFSKIDDADQDDLADARVRAERQLAGLPQRKEAAWDFPPVEGTLEDYETILRDIRNLERPSRKDIAEIQDRIERTGLIASMKAYQPRIVVRAEP